MAVKSDRSALTNYRKFFLRGLAILLPSILTIWILVAAYNFVSERIAEPINRGVKHLILMAIPGPAPPPEVGTLPDPLTTNQRKAWRAWLTDDEVEDWKGNETADAFRQIVQQRKLEDWWDVYSVRQRQLENWWGGYSFPLDLIGLLVACFLIYLIGGLVGNFIGAGILRYIEDLLLRVPGVKQVYPHVKQVTDFLVGEKQDKLTFSKVVAVQYPRKGLWSVGLVTGETMRSIQEHAGERCVTVFVPSSPTPFTGYVITVPDQDTIDLGVSIEEALRFAVSGGVIIPPSQQIESGDGAALGQLTTEGSMDRASS